MSRSGVIRLLACACVPIVCGTPSERVFAQTANPSRPPAAERPIDFAREIKPILSNNCFYCHGPDAAERKGGTGGLRLDTPEGAQADLGDGEAAIVPGQPDKSVLVRRITSADADEVMPPPTTGKKLTPREIELLTAWVRQGAPYALHWSYQKPVRPQLPAVQNQAWARGAIDRFLLARLEREHLQPAAEADRYTLIRRLSLDLVGLPPTVAEAEAFAHDPDPQAYEKLVDRLLAKDAYGENWAQMWLDLARYADSAGYADDPPREIWLFRDYVIRALNANKPFDQFTIEQIAGDLLPNPTEDQLIATAFHRNTLTNNEGGTNDEEFRNVAVVDRVNTTMAVWMGTTIACAQCHNHKFDPLSQEEFFRLFALFNNSEDADRRDETPILSVYTPEQLRNRGEAEQRLADVDKRQREQVAAPEFQSARDAWDAAFPRELAWRVPKPATASSASGAKLTVEEDGSVDAVDSGAGLDKYTIDLPLDGGTLHALRLEALPDDKLPGKGPGHAGGSFLVAHMAASITPPAGVGLNGRYVRIELPGKSQNLHLAEVQVFRGEQNVARDGVATQSSTSYDGPAKLAIDGNTDGRFHEAHSTSHTATSNDPWWEVDLQAEQPLDRIVVWNRTDSGTGARLKFWRLVVLNERREPVWQQSVSAAPAPSAEFSLSGARSIDFASAVADFAEAGMDPASVIEQDDPKDKKLRGWSNKGEAGRAHALTLTLRSPVELPAGGTLQVTLDFTPKRIRNTLGHFRLSLSDDPRAGEWGRAPKNVIDALVVPPAKRSPAQAKQVGDYYATFAPGLANVRQEREKLTRDLAAIKPATVPVMRDLAEKQHRVTKIQHRGNFLDLGAEVTAGTPAVFPPLPAGSSPNRLALARWLVAEDNPLTARVVVNRYWEQIFGIGIVSSSEEFGSQGDLPYHPELLDWLAVEFMQSHWDVKALVKLLVTSAAYRQSSRVSAELEQRDPDNRLLARGPRFRLSAEVVRDQALAASGLLSPTMFGPPVKPMQPSLGLNAAFGGAVDWQTSTGNDRYRRALYTTWRRSSPYPSMATFDAPNREVCTVRRGRTNTPLQALVTLNDPVYVETAQALARRIVAEVPAAGDAAAAVSSDALLARRATHGFRLCLLRAPSDAEVVRLVELYKTAKARFDGSADDAAKMATDPLGPAGKDANLAELAAWTVVGNVLLNLDETLMKR